MLSIRAINGYCLLVCLALLATAIGLQLVLHLEPCPLCVIQRAFVCLLGFLFLLGIFLRSAKWLKHHSMLVTVVAIVGACLSARQVYLQHLPPDQIPSCGPGLSFMLAHLPLWKTLQLLFVGTGDCAQVQWQLWGLSIPEWTFLVFIGFTLVGFSNYYRARRQA